MTKLLKEILAELKQQKEPIDLTIDSVDIIFGKDGLIIAQKSQ